MVGNTRDFSLYDTPQYTELPSCARLPFVEGCDSLDCQTNNCFCRPDLVQSAISTVSSRANAACGSILPAAAGSALAVIVNYCTGNGFVVSTCSGEMTSMASLPTSSTALPGGLLLFIFNLCMWRLLTAIHFKVHPLALSRRHTRRLRCHLAEQAIVYRLVPSRRLLQKPLKKYYLLLPSLWRLGVFYYFGGPGRGLGYATMLRYTCERILAGIRWG